MPTLQKFLSLRVESGDAPIPIRPRNIRAARLSESSAGTRPRNIRAAPRGGAATRPRRRRRRATLRRSPFASRLQKAHNNCLECYPFFAASVLAAIQAGVPASTVSDYATLAVASRVLYCGFYAFGVNEAIGAMRTFSWVGSLVCAAYLFLAAAAVPLSKKK